MSCLTRKQVMIKSLMNEQSLHSHCSKAQRLPSRNGLPLNFVPSSGKSLLAATVSMSRDALLVGVNIYQWDELPNVSAPIQ